MKKKIYISIPIAGLVLKEQKEHAQKIEASLSNFYEVVSPFNNGVDEDEHPSVHMRADFKMLLECDAIFMCKGWEDSAGCRAEWQVAVSCHMDITYESNQSKYFK